MQVGPVGEGRHLPHRVAQQLRTETVLGLARDAGGRLPNQHVVAAQGLDRLQRAGLDASFARIRSIVDASAPEAGETPSAVAAAAEVSESPAAAAAAADARQVDRLRQIGGFVMGGVATQKDLIAERTEQWTRRTAEAVDALLREVKRPATSAPSTL
jgi:hypothetical protein